MCLMRFLFAAFGIIWAGQAQANPIDLTCYGIQTDLNPFTYRGVASSVRRISFRVSLSNNYLIIQNAENSVSLPISMLTEEAVVSESITEEISHPLAKTKTRFRWLVNISRIDGKIMGFKTLAGTDSVWLSIDGKCQSQKLF